MKVSISQVEASYAIALGIRTGQAADVAVLEPSDAVPYKWVAHAVLFLGTAYYIRKMEKEIEGIRRRAGGPNGYMYELTAKSKGSYPVITWGSPLPTSSMILNRGDVWKYGETSSKNERYSDLYKDNIGDGGVHENPIFYGNQVQIKVAEKEALYRYFLLHGHLPPGNKIFR